MPEGHLRHGILFQAYFCAVILTVITKNRNYNYRFKKYRCVQIHHSGGSNVKYLNLIRVS